MTAHKSSGDCISSVLADKTYMEMAGVEGYNPGHMKDVGAQLWQSLYKALGEKVTKNNLHGVVQRTAQKQNNVPSSLALHQSSTSVYAD